MSVEVSRQAGHGPVRIPVEHRFLGMDRRSFPFALFAVAVFLVATVVVPRVNDAIGWDDPVVAGDELVLSKTTAFTPATGWNVESGFRREGSGTPARSGAATVIGDGVTFAVVPGAFTGTPAELVRQITKVTSSTGDTTFAVDGTATTVTTSSGEVGVVQPYSSVRGDGLVAAFVIDGTGLEVTVVGPPAQMAAARADITAMIASIRRIGARGEAS